MTNTMTVRDENAPPSDDATVIICAVIMAVTMAIWGLCFALSRAVGVPMRIPDVAWIITGIEGVALIVYFLIRRINKTPDKTVSTAAALPLSRDDGHSGSREGSSSEYLVPATTPPEPSEMGARPDHRACAHAVALEAIAEAMHFDETTEPERRHRRVDHIHAAAQFLRNASTAFVNRGVP